MTAATKWIVLVYGAYGINTRDMRHPQAKVVEVEAESLAGVWEKLRLGAMTGDALDDLVLTSLQPSLEPVNDTSHDARVRVFRADEVPFSLLDEYMTARVARETEERKAANEASQLAAMQAIAARLGYQCVKAGS